MVGAPSILRSGWASPWPGVGRQSQAPSLQPWALLEPMSSRQAVQVHGNAFTGASILRGLTSDVSFHPPTSAGGLPESIVCNSVSGSSSSASCVHTMLHFSSSKELDSYRNMSKLQHLKVLSPAFLRTSCRSGLLRTDRLKPGVGLAAPNTAAGCICPTSLRTENSDGPSLGSVDRGAPPGPAHSGSGLKS